MHYKKMNVQEYDKKKRNSSVALFVVYNYSFLSYLHALYSVNLTFVPRVRHSPTRTAAVRH